MNRQFDVFRSPSGIVSRGNVIVAPLVPPNLFPVSRAYPVLALAHTSVMMLTPDLAVIPKHLLKRPIENLSDQRDRIIAAIDLLFAGS